MPFDLKMRGGGAPEEIWWELTEVTVCDDLCLQLVGFAVSLVSVFFRISRNQPALS
jgi:hypothetical protein